MAEEVKITQKHQVTTPESIRSKLGIKIGDKLIVKSENKRIIMESRKRISNPSDLLWRLFGKPIDVDAVKLLEESWERNLTSADSNKRNGENHREEKH